MYQIDKIKNRIKPIQVKRFAELGFHEREHLQEWLARRLTLLLKLVQANSYTTPVMAMLNNDFLEMSDTNMWLFQCQP